MNFLSRQSDFGKPVKGVTKKDKNLRAGNGNTSKDEKIKNK